MGGLVLFIVVELFFVELVVLFSLFSIQYCQITWNIRALARLQFSEYYLCVAFLLVEEILRRPVSSDLCLFGNFVWLQEAVVVQQTFLAFVVYRIL